MKILFLALLTQTASAELHLSPQIVVERILNEGRQAKTIELDARSAYTDYYGVTSIYDLGVAARVSKENSRITTITGGGNLQDRNTVWSLTASKRVPTGTLIELGYNRTQQNSVFRTPSLYRGPYAVYDVGELTITQDLLGNFFGIAERKAIRSAKEKLASAQLLKKEQQELLVLDSLRLFWDAYVHRESLREALAQRDKYEALVKEVQTKSRLAFSSPGDLPKAKAEFGAQVRNVKESFFTFSQSLDKLLTAMRMDETQREAVKFDLDEELPPLPTMVMPGVDSLRLISVYKSAYDAAIYKKQATDLSANWPELKLIGSAGYTGLDATSGKAFSAMRSGNSPRYLVALELSYKFFSDAYRASLNDADVGYERAANDLDKAREDLGQQVGTAMENVRFTYAAAVSAAEEMKNWDEAVKAQERLYRQGRLDFSQLIQDYNSYYRARSVRIRALGDYHIALNAYAATVDELVK